MSNDKLPKAEITLRDPAFNESAQEHCTLILELTRDHIACAVYDRERMMWVALEIWPTGKVYLPGHLLEMLVKIRETSSLMKGKYAQTQILWGGPVYTLVPGALFDAPNSEVYLGFVRNIEPGEAVIHEEMKNTEAYTVYALPHILKEGINQMFPLARIRHTMSGLIENFLIQYKNDPVQPAILVNMGAISFDMLVLNEGKLKFCNSFEYSTAEDVLYYIMFSFEQLGIAAAKAQLMVCGEIMKPSAIEELMSKYIGTLKYLPRNPAIQCSYVFDELPDHRLFNLFNTILCE
jgi:hypothetical protein